MNLDHPEPLADAIRSVVPADPSWRAKAEEKISRLAMPPGALGRLLDLAAELAAITRSLEPSIRRRSVVVMAGDHGVVAEGVSAFPQAVTLQMVRNLARGGAAVNVLAEQAAARVIVVDTGVVGDLDDIARSGAILGRRIAPGTRNLAAGPAMTREEAGRAVAIGLDLAADLAGSNDILATGEMGIGNTTPSAAIVSVFCGAEPGLVTGCGTGIDEAARRRKAKVVANAIEVNRPHPSDPIGVLAKVGGFEIGALAGLIIGAAAARKPVLLDGFISTAAALVAHALCPASADYMIASHRSVEPGHDAALARLGKRPLLDLGLRLGEGTGAVLAMHLVESAARILARMATFEEAGVSDRIQ